VSPKYPLLCVSSLSQVLHYSDRGHEEVTDFLNACHPQRVSPSREQGSNPVAELYQCDSSSVANAIGAAGLPYPSQVNCAD
jgi:hypothetical protein